MCHWIRRLFGMAEKPAQTAPPKRRTALQRLNQSCAAAMIDHERHPKGSGHHGLEAEPESKPDSKQR
jgi:hypothetical protein